MFPESMTKKQRLSFIWLKEGRIEDILVRVTLEDFSIRDKNGMSLIDLARIYGQQQVLDKYYELIIPDIDNPYEKLLYAVLAWQPKEEVVKLFDQMEHQLNDKLYLLSYAAEYGHLNFVQWLLEDNKVDINNLIKDNSTPLYLAASFGHLQVVDFLLKQQLIEVNKGRQYDDKFSSPLTIASSTTFTKVVKLLSDNPQVQINHNEINNEGTPLCVAAANGRLKNVQILLNHPKIDVNAARKSDGSTPLYLAAQNGHTAVVKRLLQVKGIDINLALTNTNITPLHTAILNGHKVVVRVLLNQQKISVNTIDKENGSTPLHAAIENQNQDPVAMVELLLNNPDIEPHVKRKIDGRTPLELAVQQGFTKSVILLLQRTKTLPHDDLLNYLKIAQYKKDNEMSALLENHLKTMQSHSDSSNLSDEKFLRNDDLPYFL